MSATDKPEGLEIKFIRKNIKQTLVSWLIFGAAFIGFGVFFKQIMLEKSTFNIFFSALFLLVFGSVGLLVFSIVVYSIFIKCRILITDSGLTIYKSFLSYKTEQTFLWSDIKSVEARQCIRSENKISAG
ncbi:MAG: hypothetical protein A2Z20_07825 [Bdellovibrionales bacterium RBG_16_40_8]|nr:MAG: hypothetical protein A2Z20_07825 [Bdellovibrionales bacterium RBG_16_40_8]